MTGYYKTIADLEKATYGSMGGDSLLKSYTDNPLTGIHGQHDFAQAARTTSLYNIVYGQKVWSMINREINGLSMLPKKPWKSSGWRILKERAIGGGADVFGYDLSASGNYEEEHGLGGVGENAALSSLENVRPVYDVLSVTPKTIAHTFEVSEIAQLMGGLDDGIGDIMKNYREEVGLSHAESMNKQILLDLHTTDGLDDSNQPTNAVDRQLTSLYRIVSTFAEQNALSLANAVKIYGTARTASSDPHLESFVDSNSGTDRALTVNLLNTALRTLMARGGDPKVILTGYDTIQTLGELLQAQERFMGRSEIVPTHNGIKGVEGREVGFRVATYHDIPIIPVKDMPQSGRAGLSDMLILDTDHLFLCTLKPTEYFEGGINADVFGHGKLGHRGLYRTVAETVCTYFRGQGKIIDIN